MAFSIDAPKEWNCLLADLRLAPTLCSFKTKQKLSIIDVGLHTICVQYMYMYVYVHVYICLDVALQSIFYYLLYVLM